MASISAHEVLQTAQNRLGKVGPPFFLLVGAIWLLVTFTSSELVLVWPAIASILSGISLVVASAKTLRMPLGVASSLFGLVIALFQLYLAFTLVGTELGGLVVYSLGTFILLVVLQGILLYSSATTRA